MSDVTRILSAIEQGDSQAAEQLLPLVYEELRRLAAHKLAHENPGHTLQATALVHEAYLRLVGSETPRLYRDRAHFFTTAATAMRRILTDNARLKNTDKHGGQYRREPLQDIADTDDGELLALNEAMQKLAAQDPLKAQLVELRYFAGLTGDQAAEVLGLSTSTADRNWAYARAWLQAEVRGR
jgi:RNA polymerase sigma factor (TIGR02999 family)